MLLFVLLVLLAMLLSYFCYLPLIVDVYIFYLAEIVLLCIFGLA